MKQAGAPTFPTWGFMYHETCCYDTFYNAITQLGRWYKTLWSNLEILSFAGFHGTESWTLMLFIGKKRKILGEVNYTCLQLRAVIPANREFLRHEIVYNCWRNSQHAPQRKRKSNIRASSDTIWLQGRVRNIHTVASMGRWVAKKLLHCCQLQLLMWFIATQQNFPISNKCHDIFECLASKVQRGTGAVTGNGLYANTQRQVSVLAFDF